MAPHSGQAKRKPIRQSRTPQHIAALPSKWVRVDIAVGCLNARCTTVLRDCNNFTKKVTGRTSSPHRSVTSVTFCPTAHTANGVKLFLTLHTRTQKTKHKCKPALHPRTHTSPYPKPAKEPEICPPRACAQTPTLDPSLADSSSRPNKKSLDMKKRGKLNFGHEQLGNSKSPAAPSAPVLDIPEAFSRTNPPTRTNLSHSRAQTSPIEPSRAQSSAD